MKDFPGSARHHPAGARILGPAHPNEHVEVTIVLKEFSEDAVSRIFEYLPNVTYVSERPASRTVKLAGTVADMNQAFGVELQEVEHPEGGTYRGRSGMLQLPEELHEDVVAVLGLDNRPQAKPHLRCRSVSHVGSSYTPQAVAALYDFPGSGLGAGQSVAIIELGGGYKLKQDLVPYLGRVPHISTVRVDGGRNAPVGNPDGADGEVELDIEIVGAIAPQANIVVYFAPNTDAGFLDAINAAVHDQVHRPCVISISWGAPEVGWTQQAMTAMDMALADAEAMGIVVTVASGDNGSDDGVGDGKTHVDFPASSPHALACGGTTLRGSGTTIAAETVWNDGPGAGATGGGYSAIFTRPSYQQGTNPMRGVPDVSGDADPATGYDVRVDGRNFVLGGTSAVAPLWAALVARIVSAGGKRLAPIHGKLYGNPQAFRDITQGDNGAWQAGAGWDPCTGLGSPIGNMISQLF